MKIELKPAIIKVNFINVFLDKLSKNNKEDEKILQTQSDSETQTGTISKSSMSSSNILNSETPNSQSLYSKTPKSESGTSKSHSTIPANGHDICNYVARYGLANFQIQLVMKLDGKLNFELLSRAVRRSVDVEPVLGCRFIEKKRPIWKRRNNIDNITFCTMEETDNPDEAIQRFLESPLDMDNDLMVKVMLICTESYDTLCVKLNHTCCDAAGTKEYLALLSRIYCSLSQNNNDFILEPRIHEESDEHRLFKALGIKNSSKTWMNQLNVPLPMWKFPWRKGPHNVTQVTVCRFSAGQLEELSKYGKKEGATINDLLLTAVYRAMFVMSKPPYGLPMEISITVDLRRYLPDHKTNAIRNLSGGVTTRIARIKNETFVKTLHRVQQVMNKIKKGRPGIQNALAAENVEKLNFMQTSTYFKSVSQIFEWLSQLPVHFVDKCAPVLSNVGYISQSPILFGETTVIDSYIVPPAVREPGFLLAASTYNGIITLSACYYKSTLKKSYVEALLNKIKEELSLCITTD